jgi:hypothetical protein
MICHWVKVRVGKISKFVVRTLHIPADICPATSESKFEFKAPYKGFFTPFSVSMSSSFSDPFPDWINNLNNSNIGAVNTS